MSGILDRFIEGEGRRDLERGRGGERGLRGGQKERNREDRRGGGSSE